MMNSKLKMTSMQRVLTTLGHQEPDRVPLFLLLTMHGAKELGMTIREYFSRPGYVAEGQRRLREKYSSDCYYTFHYASLELEAWGGESLYYDDGPPNAGEPVITAARIAGLEAPRVADSPGLQRVLEATRLLKESVGDDVPIIGVAMSPFSLPVMQMGFEAYLNLLYGDPATRDHLLALNSQFCVEWSNAQLAAGATAICYFDPVSSPTILPPDMYRSIGFPLTQKTRQAINGPIAIHLASARTIPIIGDVAEAGAAVIGVGFEENLSMVKAACRGRLAVLGNLNGIAMTRWTVQTASEETKRSISQAGPGGGFILSDSHGEIPWQVSDETLTAISDAVHEWGNYPLKWLQHDET